MSSDAPADEAIEETNLLDASDGPQQPPESARNRGYWVQLLANLLGAIKATLSSSIANFLLPLVPLAIISESLNWNSVAVFLLNFFAMLPLASLLSYSTEELSENVGQTLGGLINATCGNLVELIVGITALSRGEIRVVQSSMVGSVLSGILLILGTCFLFAGWGKHLLTFNKDVTAMTASLLVVASASLVVPLAISFGTAGTQPEQDDGILLVSRTTSIVLLILYGVYLWFQTMTHARLFQAGKEDEEECHELGRWTAVVVLILATLGVTVCSDKLVDSIDGFVESAHVGRPFIGMIIVAIVGNIGEYFTTVNVAMKGKLDLAIALVVGSTLQIALFVTPFLVILGWILGQPMTLKFGMFETIVFTLSVLVVNYLIQDGRTNYFAGALLIGTYIVLAIAFYIHPNVAAEAMG